MLFERKGDSWVSVGYETQKSPFLTNNTFKVTLQWVCVFSWAPPPSCWSDDTWVFCECVCRLNTCGAAKRRDIWRHTSWPGRLGNRLHVCAGESIHAYCLCVCVCVCVCVVQFQGAQEVKYFLIVLLSAYITIWRALSYRPPSCRDLTCEWVKDRLRSFWLLILMIRAPLPVYLLFPDTSTDGRLSARPHGNMETHFFETWSQADYVPVLVLQKITS